MVCPYLPQLFRVQLQLYKLYKSCVILHFIMNTFITCKTLFHRVMALRDVCVVLPAGGCGVRMKIDTPKQYCQVLNRPLILHTIHSFHR